LALLTLAGAGCRINPVTGAPELVLVSAGQELALGHQTHPNVIFMYDGEYRDPQLNRYLGTIVMRLHECSHRREMPTEFTMLNTSVVNAFATPGHVYATRGFLGRLKNEAQFASVMGHELAHVTAGHSAKQLTRGVLTGLTLGTVDRVVGGSVVGGLAVGVGKLSVALLGLSYSREQERQADRVGTYYMALAGWDPREAVAMQELLASLNKRQAGVMDRYLSTHPQSDDRIGEIRGVIEEKDLASARYVQGDGIYAARWERRLRDLRQVGAAFEPFDEGEALMEKENYAAALGAAEKAIGLRDDQAPFYRLRGDALRELGRLREAAGAYGKALTLDPRYVPANIGLGVVLLAQEKFSEAERQFAMAAHGYPNSLAAWYGLGVARFQMRLYADAIEPLETAAGALPKTPEVHYMLAVCYDQTGRPAEAYASYVRALDAGLSGPERREAQQRVRILQGYAPAG
jgi:predicted Zn-dependent protease